MGGGAPPAPAGPLGPLGPGGGGRGYGGGGGGGAPAMTQQMFDAMLAALGTRAPQLTLNQVDLPDFRGQNIPAFSARPYQQMAQQLATAVGRDRTAINQGAQQTTQALGAFSAHPYAGAAVAPTTRRGTGGGVAGHRRGHAGWCCRRQRCRRWPGSPPGRSGEAAFNDLLKVLGCANYNQSQNLPPRRGADDRPVGTQPARGAEPRGSPGQIKSGPHPGLRAVADSRMPERRYQNSLMAQQWQRVEEQTRNQDIGNQQAQGRWQQGNEMIQNRLTPLLQLIQGTAGTKINMGALTKLLAGWGCEMSDVPQELIDELVAQYLAEQGAPMTDEQATYGGAMPMYDLEGDPYDLNKHSMRCRTSTSWLPTRCSKG